jgi:GNAT superfamily N-acetyltransferase
MKNNTPKFTIPECDVETAAAMSAAFPGFKNPCDAAEITGASLTCSISRMLLLPETRRWVLNSFSGNFYFWPGGVLPEYRRLGIASTLAQEQEDWAKQQGYSPVFFKTRNRRKAMLIFALKNGFDMAGFEEK